MVTSHSAETAQKSRRLMSGREPGYEPVLALQSVSLEAVQLATDRMLFGSPGRRLLFSAEGCKSCLRLEKKIEIPQLVETLS